LEAVLPVLERFIRRFPGSSIPAEIETTDGGRWVIKMKGAGNGVQSLAAEFLVNRSALALGWPVPTVCTIEIPQGFPWTFGTDEFDDILQKSYGLNLGLQYLGDCTPLDGPTVLALPPAFLSQMATLDAFFLNYDRLPASRNTLRDPAGRDWLCDHGSCLFLDADLSGKPWALAPGHLLGAAGHALIRPENARLLGEAALEEASNLPQPWLDELSLPIDRLRALIHARLKAQA
jgi:hypothetical protein